MSDENRDMESVDYGLAALPGVGSQLKAAREAKKMSVVDIAMALKLGPKQVEALENGDWHGLPGHTFIRGFVRNYARVLQLDPAPLMGQLDAVLESPQQRLSLPGQQRRQVAMPQAGRPRRRDYVMALSGVALVLVATGIYFLLPSDLSSLRSSVESVVALFSNKEPVPEAPATAAQPQPEPLFPPGSTPQQVMNPQAEGSGEPGSAAAPAPVLVPPPVQQAPQQAGQPQAPTPAAAPPAESPAPATAAAASPPAETAVAGEKTAVLHFAFDQDSWVEVRDRNGKVLLSQSNRAGTERNVDGQGPFKVVIGNAPGVKLTLRGQPVDTKPRTQGNVARLTLE